MYPNVNNTEAGKIWMMFPALVLFLLINSCSGPVESTGMIDLETIEQQLLLLDDNVQKEIAQSLQEENSAPKAVPRTINKDGSLRVVPTGDWTSGFYPGILWRMYEMTGKPEWKEKAMNYTGKLEKEMYNGSNHDVGFRMFCSYGNGLRLTGDTSYIPDPCPISQNPDRTLLRNRRKHQIVGF